MRFATSKYTIREFVNEKGKSLFKEWLKSLSIKFQARIQARILRFEEGNLGDSKSVGGGVWEARFDFGPGFRVYFAFEGKEVILLLLGGNKSTQKRDIKKAQEIWLGRED
jgi:putative addiction module killer protein